MRVGTDGIILGSWVNVRGDERRVLDVGCGTGLLALMIAQRNAAAMIRAVEIEPMAAQEAALNASRSPWAERIEIYETSFQRFAAENGAAGQRFDLIVSNPPYFLNSPHNETLARTAARHAALLPYAELIDGVLDTLDSDGRFAAIFPYSEANVFIAQAAAKGLYCNRKMDIHPMPHRPIKRIAAEFSLRKIPIIEQNLIIEHAKGEYTEQYIALTQSFYLRF